MNNRSTVITANPGLVLFAILLNIGVGYARSAAASHTANLSPAPQRSIRLQPSGAATGSCPLRRDAGDPGLNAHLFVVGDLTGNAYRYTIINGGLPGHPDLEFTPAYKPSAVDAQGNYYVRKDDSSTDGDILVYPHGSNHPSRTLQASVPGAIAFGAASLAVDATGYLYYGYTAQFPRGFGAGIYVYAPGASGSAQPVQSVKLGHGFPPATPSGMALGPGGKLFVFGGNQKRVAIVVYSNFLTHPTVVRKFYALGLSSATGLAVDESGDSYITDVQKNDIAVYASSASGRARPIRTMTIACLRSIAGRIAILGNEGFAVDDVGNAIYEFDRRIPGLQNPIKVVPTPETPYDISIGQF